jgi:hypothetical protein
MCSWTNTTERFLAHYLTVQLAIIGLMHFVAWGLLALDMDICRQQQLQLQFLRIKKHSPCA